MKRDLRVRNSFIMDENQQLRIDKSKIFTEDERRRHELCLRLLDTIRDSVSTFKPSNSLAQIKTLESISHESLYDYFIPEDDHIPLNDAKAPPVSTNSKGRKPKVEIDLVISGGGLKGYFMTGCSHILKHELKKQNISIRRIAGASAGAWCGLFMLCDFSTSNWIETYYLCRDRITKTIHETYEEMWPWAQEHLPPNAYEICSGRLFISITEITWSGLKNHIISEFTSNQDLFEACLASSAIPYLTFPGLIKKYRGMYVLDGGITNNTPIFPDLPRRTLVFRLTDIFYPAQLLVIAHDACIEALVVRGAILMSRFLQGEPSDSFAWVEYDHTLQEAKISGSNLVGMVSSSSTSHLLGSSSGTRLIRKSNIFHRVFNIVYYSTVLGGLIYTIARYVDNGELWFVDYFKSNFSPRLESISRNISHLAHDIRPSWTFGSTLGLLKRK